MPKGKEIVKAKPNDDYTIDLLFEDGSEKVFDMRPYLDDEPYSRLKDLKEFKKVKILLGSLHWDWGLDLCPTVLYDRAGE